MFTKEINKFTLPPPVPGSKRKIRNSAVQGRAGQGRGGAGQGRAGQGVQGIKIKNKK